MCSHPYCRAVKADHFVCDKAQLWPRRQVVVKSQILAGGRGLGHFTNGLKGGVHIVKAADAPALAEKMLGGTLVGSCAPLQAPARLLLRFMSIRKSAVLNALLQGCTSQDTICSFWQGTLLPSCCLASGAGNLSELA